MGLIFDFINFLCVCVYVVHLSKEKEIIIFVIVVVVVAAFVLYGNMAFLLSLKSKDVCFYWHRTFNRHLGLSAWTIAENKFSSLIPTNHHSNVQRKTGAIMHSCLIKNILCSSFGKIVIQFVHNSFKIILLIFFFSSQNYLTTHMLGWKKNLLPKCSRVKHSRENI